MVRLGTFRRFREREVIKTTAVVALFMNVTIHMQLTNLPGDTEGALGVVLATFTLTCLYQWNSASQDQVNG